MVSQFLPDDAATLALGRELAVGLNPGDIVLLSGDLGSGKTSLARAIIRQLMGDEGLDVPSPSFALVQPYETPDGVSILHADLYRLTDPREIDELGLLETPQAIVLVEWPERAPELFARAALRIGLTMPPDGQGRLVEIERTS
jgi:tRNA threonylcarbamoyladenosine biosynthesis protein TsaE